MKKQVGFTIVELVVVIIILGILAATALPRFIDVSDEAHTAVVDAVKGSLATGSTQWHAKWLANGKPASATVGSTTQYFTAEGYIAGTDSTDNAIAVGDCDEIFQDLLGDSNSPAISSTPVASLAAAQAAYGTDSGAYDWYFDLALQNTDQCYFYYVGAGETITGKTLSYDPSTGVVATI